MSQDNRVQRLIELAGSAFAAPPGRRRIVIALCFGVICHLLFAVAIASMMYSMFYGLTTGVGQVPYPWAVLANLFLVLQFPLAHSLLLTKRGMKVLSSLAPATHGRTLSTTTYAIIASLQLISLFWLWTPSGIIWWEAKGSLFFAVCVAYTFSWLLLIKAIFDAGIDLQSGALGWLSLLAKKGPCVSGYANLRFISLDPAAHLCCFCHNTLDNTCLDTRSANPGDCVDLLLHFCSHAERAAICRNIPGAFFTLPGARSVHDSQTTKTENT